MEIEGVYPQRLSSSIGPALHRAADDTVATTDTHTSQKATYPFLDQLPCLTALTEVRSDRADPTAGATELPVPAVVVMEPRAAVAPTPSAMTTRSSSDGYRAAASTRSEAAVAASCPQQGWQRRQSCANVDPQPSRERRRWCANPLRRHDESVSGGKTASHRASFRLPPPRARAALGYRVSHVK